MFPAMLAAVAVMFDGPCNGRLAGHGPGCLGTGRRNAAVEISLLCIHVAVYAALLGAGLLLKLPCLLSVVVPYLCVKRLASSSTRAHMVNCRTFTFLVVGDATVANHNT